MAAERDHRRRAAHRHTDTQTLALAVSSERYPTGSAVVSERTSSWHSRIQPASLESFQLIDAVPAKPDISKCILKPQNLNHVNPTESLPLIQPEPSEDLTRPDSESASDSKTRDCTSRDTTCDLDTAPQQVCESEAGQWDTISSNQASGGLDGPDSSLG
eukprot:3940619-Rhodomonas_salina.2